MTHVDGEQTLSVLPTTARYSLAGDLEVGGCSLIDLATRFGTPLYVYDRSTLTRCANRVKSAFSPLGARISYASKACELHAVLTTFREQGLGLDVVSLGELHAGLRAGFAATEIHLHGNAKSDDELTAAIEHDLHAVVVDNLEELERLAGLCVDRRRTARVMLRLTVPVEAHTHPHLMTGGLRSKFGLSWDDAVAARDILTHNHRLCLTGLHAHLGSQIADVTVFQRGLTELSDRLDYFGLRHAELSIGGGWAVPYRPGDPVLSADQVAAALAPTVACHPHVQLAVEPGRAMVARSAVALYRVIAVKGTSTGRLVAVDGGMGDNPRPALYGAQYTAFSLPWGTPDSAEPADVVGRYCESGDVLARGVPLPPVERGDLIVLPVAGAYQLAMAGNYNLVPRPAALMVEAGRSRLIRRRDTIQWMLAGDEGLEWESGDAQEHRPVGNETK